VPVEFFQEEKLMKYRVSGQSKETASRMAIEVEANSRGAAQKKAENAGIEVHRIEEILSTEEMIDDEPVRGSRGPFRLIRWAVLLILLLIVILYLTGNLGREPAPAPDGPSVEYGLVNGPDMTAPPLRL
jgi:hypothetical protein